MKEYKGIYHGEIKEQQFYEHGAHFKYSSLYEKLELIANQTDHIVHNLKNLRSCKKQNLFTRSNELPSNVS